MILGVTKIINETPSKNSLGIACICDPKVIVSDRVRSRHALKPKSDVEDALRDSIQKQRPGQHLDLESKPHVIGEISLHYC